MNKAHSGKAKGQRLIGISTVLPDPCSITMLRRLYFVKLPVKLWQKQISKVSRPLVTLSMRLSSARLHQVLDLGLCLVDI